MGFPRADGPATPSGTLSSNYVHDAFCFRFVLVMVELSKTYFGFHGMHVFCCWCLRCRLGYVIKPSPVHPRNVALHVAKTRNLGHLGACPGGSSQVFVCMACSLLARQLLLIIAT